MTKKELVGRMYDLLRASGVKKPVSIPRQKYTITDEEGNSRSFTVKRKDHMTYYTVEDIRQMFNAFIAIMIDAMRHGDPVYIQQIGTFGIVLRRATKVRVPGTNEWKSIPEHYVPRIRWSEPMREAARIYESYLRENIDVSMPARPKRKRGRPSLRNPDSIEYEDILGLLKDEDEDAAPPIQDDIEDDEDDPEDDLFEDEEGVDDGD